MLSLSPFYPPIVLVPTGPTLAAGLSRSPSPYYPPVPTRLPIPMADIEPWHVNVNEEIEFSNYVDEHGDAGDSR